MELQFGHYTGLAISDAKVPTGYLEWLLDRMVEDAKNIQSELLRRKKPEWKDWRRDLTIWRRNQTYANKILATDDPEAEDVEWARKILSDGPPKQNF
jgi:hypothetical protein